MRDYVCRIEQAIIDTLAEWNIEGARREGAPGVYVGAAKVAALGIRVRRGCTFHGLAFNIAGESTAPFLRINPCGYHGLDVVALQDLGGPSSLEAVKPVLLAQLARQGDTPAEPRSAYRRNRKIIDAVARKKFLDGCPRPVTLEAADFS